MQPVHSATPQRSPRWSRRCLRRRCGRRESRNRNLVNCQRWGQRSQWLGRRWRGWLAECHPWRGRWQWWSGLCSRLRPVRIQPHQRTRWRRRRWGRWHRHLRQRDQERSPGRGRNFTVVRLWRARNRTGWPAGQRPSGHAEHGRRRGRRRNGLRERVESAKKLAGERCSWWLRSRRHPHSLDSRNGTRIPNNRLGYSR